MQLQHFVILEYNTGREVIFNLLTFLFSLQINNSHYLIFWYSLNNLLNMLNIVEQETDLNIIYLALRWCCNLLSPPKALRRGYCKAAVILCVGEHQSVR